MVTLDLFNVKADGLRGITLASPEGELPSQGSSPVLFVGIEKCTQLAGAAPRSESAAKRAGFYFPTGVKSAARRTVNVIQDREAPVLRDPRRGSRGSRFSPVMWRLVPVPCPL